MKNKIIKKHILNIFFILFLLPLFSCNINESNIDKELRKWNIEVVGEAEIKKTDLPESLKSQPWSSIKYACNECDYNLNKYKGKSLELRIYPIDQIYRDKEGLNVCILLYEEEIVCVYKSVRKNSHFAPGIFSADDMDNISN